MIVDKDGAPVPNALFCLYHTDQKGLYAPSETVLPYDLAGKRFASVVRKKHPSP